jgi:histone-lysine N-methyltransferase SETMAR
MRKKRPNNLENTILHQDNAPSHTASGALETVKNLGFELLEHAPYSPDLAPCDFYLFPKLKEALRGVHYSTDSELMQATMKEIRKLSQDGFESVFLKWVKRHEKCVSCDGRYFEKE